MPGYAYQPTIIQNPAGTWSLVGHIPAYMADLYFETEAVAQLALEEVLEVIRTGHCDGDATFAHIWLTTERPVRRGTFHRCKTLVRESDLK